jgi:hypothetical protein
MDLTASFLQYWNNLDTTIFPNAIRVAIELGPLILTVILYQVAWHVWVRYVRLKQFLGLKYTVLELHLPKETVKSPLAMEVFLNSLHNTSDGSLYAQYWKGETRPWYSLELASIEGQVKFFMWTEDRRKKNLIASLYGQFPGLEIREIEDYTKSTHFDPATMKIHALEFSFSNKDPYPIKTYVDYGLDKDPKEEFKVDPMVPLLEWLGSIGPNQQVWLQIPIRAHKADQRKPGHIFAKTDLWKDEAKALVHELLSREPDTKISGWNKETKTSNFVTVSKGEQDVVAAIERAISKQSFDCGIRMVYIATKDTFDGPNGIGGMVGSWKHFSTEHLNGIRPNGDKWMGQFEYPWQDYNNIRRNRLSKKVLSAYKRRSYFYPPYQAKKPLVMTVEELATIYHFPGSVSSTPTLERVSSKKTSAPANLPI